MKKFASATCAALILTLASPAFSQRNLGDWYVNKELGFKVKSFAKWKQIPLQPDETIAVAKFNGPDVEINFSGGTAVGNPEFLILRFERAVAAPTTGTADNPEEKPSTPAPKPTDPKERLKEMQEAMKPRSFDQWLKKGSGFSGIKKTAEPKTVKYGKLTVTEHDFTHKGNIADWHAFAADFQLDGKNIVLLYDIPAAHFEKWEDIFRQSAKSFALVEKPKAPESTASSAKKPEEGSLEAQRIRHQTDVNKVPGWTLEETEHYFIKIHNPDREFVDQVKEQIEVIRKQLEKDFPPTKPITVKSVLRVCLNNDEYHNYGGPGGSAGYWSDGTEELVIYDDKERQRSDSFRTMYHEGFHQYIYYRCGKIDPHSWYNEGTGDYYAGSNYKYGKLEIKPFLWRADLIRQAVHSKNYVPLEKIIRYTQAEYYGSNIGLCYAEGWSIIYFLREGKRLGAQGWKKEWEQILPTYLQILIETKDRDKAVEAAFKGVDLAELEIAWANFTKGV